MTTPVSPDESSTDAENELICEKLLGWRKCSTFGAQCAGWTRPDSAAHSDNTPDFTTWAEAGLILDALSSRSVDPTLEYSDGKWDCYGGDPFESFIHAYRDTGPLAIRAAALEYIRRLP